MNVILSTHGAVPVPAPPSERARMADADFPRILYSATESSRIFDSQAEVDAAGGTWYRTPTEAADAAAKAATPDPTPEGESTPPRSRR